MAGIASLTACNDDDWSKGNPTMGVKTDLGQPASATVYASPSMPPTRKCLYPHSAHSFISATRW